MVFGNESTVESRIATFKAKWSVRYRESRGIQNMIAKNLSAEVRKRLAEVARARLPGGGLRDYGRIDVRLAHDDAIYIVEANPNPVPRRGRGFGVGGGRGRAPVSGLHRKNCGNGDQPPRRRAAEFQAPGGARFVFESRPMSAKSTRPPGLCGGARRSRCSPSSVARTATSSLSMQVRTAVEAVAAARRAVRERWGRRAAAAAAAPGHRGHNRWSRRRGRHGGGPRRNDRPGWARRTTARPGAAAPVEPAAVRPGAAGPAERRPGRARRSVAGPAAVRLGAAAPAALAVAAVWPAVRVVVAPAARAGRRRDVRLGWRGRLGRARWRWWCRRPRWNSGRGRLRRRRWRGRRTGGTGARAAGGGSGSGGATGGSPGDGGPADARGRLGGPVAPGVNRPPARLKSRILSHRAWHPTPARRGISWRSTLARSRSFVGFASFASLLMAASGCGVLFPSSDKEAPPITEVWTVHAVRANSVGYVRTARSG